MNVEVFGQSVQIDETLIDGPPGEVTRQITEYLAGDRRRFDLAVTIQPGFTGEVMAALLDIPYGETRTYGELASALDTAPRAIGGGCARNPVPIVVPCHRIVAADGLGGYQYPGVKERLLALESPTATVGGKRGEI